jgi:DNA-binding CsgD family transcriptional regulator
VTRRGIVSDREAEVLTLLAQGLTNIEIGERLSISGKTVESHLARVRERTGQLNRVLLAIWWHDLAGISS